jgi:hypothetical protein
MNPQINQHVVIFFRTGIRIEGDVLVWSDQKSVIKTLDGITVIQKTLDDVMFYKIGDTKKIYKSIVEKPLSDIDLQSLANLKIELNELEREEIKEKLTTHVADGTKETFYGIPGSSIKIKGTVQRPGEKASGKNIGIGSELQDLFSKKHSGD